MSSSVALGQYVYAFVRREDAQAIIDRGLSGLNDAKLNMTSCGVLGAITSDIPVEKIRPRRQLLAAHQNVVTEISRQWDMLPVSFGLIAESDAELMRILESNADVLQQQLDRVGGQVEMNLVISLNTENAFQYFVERFPELKAAGAAVATGTASRDEMIEVGRLFEQLLGKERDEHAEKILRVLAPACKETDVQPARSEKELVRLNCLIDRAHEASFSEAVHRAAESYSEDYVFNFSGPWPPYSFVTLTLTRD